MVFLAPGVSSDCPGQKGTPCLQQLGSLIHCISNTVGTVNGAQTTDAVTQVPSCTSYARLKTISAGRHISSGFTKPLTVLVQNSDRHREEVVASLQWCHVDAACNKQDV